MIHSGLVSITFRNLTPDDLVKLSVKAGVEGIEWGGDIHVPHGDLGQARAVRRMTLDAGLSIASYGSYYRVGDQTPCPFETVLDTALELGAPLIRVWAGTQGSDRADTAYRRTVVQDAQRIAGLAAQAGLTVASEFHGHTLTDTNVSARRFLDAVDHPVFGSYWQPKVGASLDYWLTGLDMLGPQLRHLHVFQWHLSPAPKAELVRHPLGDGAVTWRPCLARAAACEGERFAMLEYVEQDDPNAFLRDAATLKNWLEELWTTR